MLIQISQPNAFVWAEFAHHSGDVVLFLADVLRCVVANNITFSANSKVILALVGIFNLLSQSRNLSLNIAESFIVLIIRYEYILFSCFKVIVFFI